MEVPRYDYFLFLFVCCGRFSCFLSVALGDIVPDFDNIGFVIQLGERH